MAVPERPKLRALSARVIENNDPPLVVLDDPRRFCPSPIAIPLVLYQGLVRHLDGRNGIEDIQRIVLQESGERVDVAFIRRLVDDLDRALALEGPTFEAACSSYQSAAVRPAALAGRSYAADARRLAGDLDRFYRAEGASGPPALPPPRCERPVAATPRLRAVVSPHIDFTRGGHAYTWAYRRLVEESDADVFIVLGVAHQYCRSRFVVTRKDFATPLGTVRSDRDFIDRLAAEAGVDLFRDELAHRTEHSVEFQAVFLRHVLGDRPFTIVPILVGSFHDFVQRRAEPIDDPEIARFIAALRSAEASCGRKVAYIGGIDLCHVGPEFGDPKPVDPAFREAVRRFDDDMLARASAADPAGWFRTAAEVDDRWRVCGLAAAYTMLHAIGPSKGTVLKYDQAVDDRGRCCVSFASMVFHEDVAAGRA